MEYVDASTLRKLSTSGDIIIVDASWAIANDVERARAAHESERIPNATFYDHDEVCDLSSPLPQAFPPREAFARGVEPREREYHRRRGLRRCCWVDGWFSVSVHRSAEDRR